MDAQADYDPCRETVIPMECAEDGIRLCHDYPDFSADEGWRLGEYTVNGPIPLSGIVSGVKISVEGEYVIDQSVTFQSCIFEMAPGARIYIVPISAATVEFNDCKFFAEDCYQLWDGINIDRNGEPLTFIFRLCHLEDARVALNLAEGTDFTYYVRDNKFINNHIGISNIAQQYLPLALYLGLNTFQAAAPLLPNYTSASLPYYPDAFAGLYFIKTQVVANQLNQSSPLQMHTNTFSCLHHGVWLEDCLAALLNNDFENMAPFDGAGIRADYGTVFARRCHFSQEGGAGIATNFANLTALGNDFSGRWGLGIQSANNFNQENVQIRENSFLLDSDTWSTGINLWRSQTPAPTLTAHNTVADNTFDIDVNCEFFTAIDLNDQIAEDVFQVYGNEITVQDHQGPISGIHLLRGDAGNGIQIFENTITVEGGEEHTNNWGINVVDASDGVTLNHELNDNTVTGAQPSSGTYTLDEGIYLFTAKNFSLCQNAVDNSNTGFRFRELNTVAFRENAMTHHNLAAWISDPPCAIGEQKGRGNTWSSNTSDYGSAITIDTNDPDEALNSEFVISESNPPTGRTFYPPGTQVTPPPNSTITPWYRFDSETPEDHCPPDNGGGGGDDAFSEYEQQFMGGTLGTSPTPARAWDLQRQLYSRILKRPALAPTGSAAETFFISLASSSAAAFASVAYDIATAGSLGATDAAALQACRDTIDEALAAIELLDAALDLTDAANLSATYLTARSAQLQTLSQQHAAESTLKTTLLADWHTDLQAARTANASLTATQPWQKARKQLTELRIGRMLGESLTATAYQQILDLAEQSPDTAGLAPYEAYQLLAPCDRRRLNPAWDNPEVEERVIRPALTQIEPATNLRVSPNPSAGAAQVTWTGNLAGGMVQVWNQQGRLVQRIVIGEGQHTANLALAGQPAGLYRVVTVTAFGKINKATSFLIQH